MTGRSPARLLAPLALVVTAVALFAVVSSGGGGGTDASGSPTPTATASPAKKRKSASKQRAKTYTVKPGDTPSSIAEKTGVSLSALLAANPDADPSALTPGQKLKLP